MRTARPCAGRFLFVEAGVTKPFDVAIIGGGIAGWSLAAFLAPRKSVLLIEREAAFGYHSTGRSAAEFAFRFHTPLVGKLATLSFDFLNTPPDGFSDNPILKRRGMILIAPEEKRDRLAEVFEQESEGTDRLALITKDEALRRAQILNPDFFTTAFADPDCWDIDVESLFQGFQRKAKAGGAVARPKAELIGAKRVGGLWQIETNNGSFAATTVVNAAGAWADEIGAVFDARRIGLTPFNRTMITVDLPEGIDWQSMPEVQEVDEDFYMKPDAGRLLLSPADENESAACDAQPDELGVAWAMHWVTEATCLRPNRPANTWAGLRTFAPDRAPVVGFDPQVDGLFWLAGQGGFGIQTSPAMGEFAANLLCGEGLPERFRRTGLTEAELSTSRFA